MAIKERKQITGTTEQINAYAGHEGQIVWDKEKKTFVGMSGTAGENYPLASQAYVANEVQKNNAQLTEGLAGKEDKGVCLPLTGGLLSGFVYLDPNYGSGSIDIGFSYEEKLGGGIGFRSINHEKNPGGFSLYARTPTQTSVLEGKPDGILAWNGKQITYIDSSGGEPWYSYYVRFSDGIQICTGQIDGGTRLSMTISYPVPFAQLFSTVVDHYGARSTEWSTTTIKIETNTHKLGYFSYFAIGRWK